MTTRTIPIPTTEFPDAIRLITEKEGEMPIICDILRPKMKVRIMVEDDGPSVSTALKDSGASALGES